MRIVPLVGTISKQLLANALSALPLGAQTNRVNMAFVLTGQQKQRVAVKLGMNPTRFSQLINGVLEPTEDERKAIAKHFGVPVEVLFPTPKTENAA